MAKSTAKEAQLFVPVYWEDAKQELMKRDRIMRRIIPMFGEVTTSADFARRIA